MIKDVSQINTETEEGQLLMGALAILTVSPELTIFGNKVDGRQCTPWEMIAHLQRARSTMYSPTAPSLGDVINL